MKKHREIIYFLVLLQILLVACSSSYIAPPLTFEDGYINKQIILRAPNRLNTFKTVDSVFLELQNNSNQKIILPKDYNIKIFEKTDDTWSEIKEIPTQRYPSDNVVLAPTETMPAVQPIFVVPELEDLKKSYQLRIYIIGNMKANEEIREVAAFIDINLHP